MEQEEVPESILEKIQKLLTLKDNEGASQGEIENAAQKITALLLKYNLSMAHVEAHKGGKKKPIMESFFNLNGTQTRHEAGWMGSLYNVIAQFNMCKAILFPGIDKDDMGSVLIIGREHNIQIVYYLVDQCRVKIRAAHKIAYKIYLGQPWEEYDDQPEKPNTFKRGFFRGAVNGIHEKLKAQKDALVKGQDNESKELGLMIVNEKNEVDLYAKSKHDFHPGREKDLKGITAGAMGYAAGKAMNLNKGVGGQGPRGLLN